ncbi:MAG: hypothetical protein CUN55_05755 [Phototrophicales bacterium]|nr:MAG: hypothetical protein CUN55_05755 [Phototrophicales bacterium]
MPNQLPPSESDKPTSDNDSELDPNTQSVLDSLDDDLEEDTSDTGTQDLLKQLDAMKPQTVKAASTLSEPTSSDEENASQKEVTPTRIQYRYRVTVSPPPHIQSVIDAAVREIGLDSAHVESNMIWQVDFQTKTEDVVIDTIARWCKNNLPIQTALMRVYCNVIGEQTYVAGWQLANDEALKAAQNRLVKLLAPLITVEPTANTVFHPILLISSNVPAALFPKLIAYLQQNFTELEWHIASCELRRQPLDEDDASLSNAEWEIAHIFNANT